MKRLLLLPVFLFLFSKANAQNNRWMYIGDKDGMTYMVDTLANDIKQLEEYDAHLNVVLIWMKTIEHKTNKKGSFIESSMVRVAVDTATNQIAIQSAAVYRNTTLIHQKNLNYTPWQDVVPETGGDVLINYCRALNNQQLMDRFISYAQSHDQKSSLKKKKN